MTRGPDFDELTGELERAERERLYRVHEMLLTAGPPPELTPQMEAGPTVAMTLSGRSRRRTQRRTALLAAAIVVLAAAFLGGYITGNDKSASGRLLQMHGTAAAPHARAQLRIASADAAGNWPMQIAAVGLPKLPAHGYYEVFLVRHGRIDAPCGSFLVKSTTQHVSVRLNSWVVTSQRAGDRTAGTVVLKPLT
jgi:hypothetical protein